jgi:hypothetical protein
MPTAPTHTADGPVIAAGAGKTFMVTDVEQPVELSVNETGVVPPPVATPATIPVDAPTDAIPGLALPHVPLPEASLKVIVAPGQTSNAPVLEVIAAGAGITFTVAVAAQPVTGSV